MKKIANIFGFRYGSRRMIRFLFALLSLLIALTVASPFAQEQQTAETDTDTIAVPIDTVPPDLVRAREILGQMEASVDSIRNIVARMKGKKGDELEVLRVQGQREFEALFDMHSGLQKLIPKLENAGLATDDLRSGFRSILSIEMDFYVRALKSWINEIDDLRDKRPSVPADELDKLETRIGEARTKLDHILEVQASTLAMADSLGMNTEQEWHTLERVLKQRAETLVGRLQIAVKARGQLEERVKDKENAGAPEAEIGVDRLRLGHAKRRVDGIAGSLENTADLLGKRGFETAKYRQFTIKTTGQITERILDPKVLIGLVQDFAGDLWSWFKENGPTVLVKLFILLIFAVVFRFGFKLVWWILRLVGLANLSRLVSDLVGRIINPVSTFLGLLAGLWFLGVDPTTLLAGVGVASVIIGFALQDSLGNLAAGFSILATRPFDVDDTIKGGGVLGTVRTMGIANTTIVTFDGRRVMIPNRKIWGEVIENRSAEFVRRVDITVKVGYEEDVDNALKILRNLVTSDDRVLESPEPQIFVSDLADCWVEIAVRPWVRNADWWPLLTDLPRLVRNRFAKDGVEIPVPRADILISNDNDADPKRPGTT